MKKSATFRFYEELNDFLPGNQGKSSFTYWFWGTPTVKDAIESQGVPHTEVDMILVNSNSVGFDYHLSEGDRVSVYPVFETLDISGTTLLKRSPLRKVRFVLDTHLGKLTRYLRMLGYDSLYDNQFTDKQIVRTSSEEHRIILTRDLGILKHNEVTHGYFLRSQESLEQAKEVISRFHLRSSIQPFTRCLKCNGILKEVMKKEVLNRLDHGTWKYFDTFFQCMSCQKIYWKGSHYKKMLQTIEVLMQK